MNNEKRVIGDCVLERIEEDVLLFRWVGTNDVDETTAVMNWMTELMNECGRAFLLVDMTEASGTTTKARRHMVGYAKDQPFSGFAFFGASFQLRVVVNLIVNALNLVRKTPQPITFSDTREGAMEWIVGERAKLAAAS